jgi:hypothetical protein
LFGGGRGARKLNSGVTRCQMKQEKGERDDAQKNADSGEKPGKYSGQNARTDFRSPL